MKTKIREYLFRRPTLFPWLMGLLLIATLFYLAIGFIGVFENSEAMMGFLFLIVTVPGMLILGIIDYLLRRLFPGKLLPIWLIESTLMLAYGLWYYQNHFYITRFITEKPAPLFVMVEDREKGIEVKRGGILQFKTEYEIPEDNVIFVKELLTANEWVRLKAETKSGEKYRQAYPMSYMQKYTISCHNRSYPIQLFMLESENMPHFLFSEKQFDSMRTVICRKIAER